MEALGGHVLLEGENERVLRQWREGATIADHGRDLIGQEAFYDVVVVDLRASCATDEDMPLLIAFPRMSELYLDGSLVTDKGIQFLARFEKLVHVGLQDTQVTEEGFAGLQKQLPNVSTNRPWEFERITGVIDRILPAPGESEARHEETSYLVDP